MSNIEIERSGGRILIKYSGEFTLEVTSALKRDIETEMTTSKVETMIVDMSGMDFIDSSGIGFIAALNSKIMSSGGRFYLFQPTPGIKKTLELVQLYNFFKVIQDPDELDLIMLG